MLLLGAGSFAGDLSYTSKSSTAGAGCLCLQNTLKQYVENKYVIESTGFKALPEVINGRAAMLGESHTSCTVPLITTGNVSVLPACLAGRGLLWAWTCLHP